MDAIRNAYRYARIIRDFLNGGEYDTALIDNPEDHIIDHGLIGTILGISGVAVSRAIRNMHESAGRMWEEYQVTAGGQPIERPSDPNLITPQKRPAPQNPDITRDEKRPNLRGTDTKTNDTSQSATDMSIKGVKGFTAGGVGQGNIGATNDEVDVVPPPAKIAKIINDYFTVQLPLGTCVDFAQTMTGQAAITKRFINLNTINTPLSGSNNDYRGRNQWASIFQYYRVLKTDVKLTWTQCTVPVMVGWHLHEDTSDSNWTTTRDMMEAKHGGFDILYPHIPDQFMVDNVASKTGTINEIRQQYSFNPSTWEHHVTKYGTEERWTAIGGSPNVPRYIHFGAVSCGALAREDGNTDTGQSFAVRCYIQLLVTVQFREAAEAVLLDEIDNTQDTNN